MTAKKPNLLRALPFLLTLCLPLLAFAENGYVAAADVAKANGMQFKDLSEGDLHAGKLTGAGIEVMLIAGYPSAVINHAPVRLSRPVRWNGTGLEVPEESVALLTGKAPAATDESPAPAPGPLRKPRTRPVGAKVVIDAGHGGHDTGAPGPNLDLDEKDITLEVALAVGAHLQSQGVTVVYTRKTDVFIELDDRAAIANRENPALFLCIHVNASDRADQRGATVYYPDDGPRDGRPGVFGRAKEAVEKHKIRPETFGAGGPVGQNAMMAVTGAAFEAWRLRSIEAARCVLKELSPVTGHIERNGGLIEDFIGYRVLRLTRCPAILVEMDFISNAASERKLNTQAYRSEIAKAIAEGVMDFLAQSSDEGAAR